MPVASPSAVADRPLRFAVIGLDHAHAFDHIHGLRAAGAQFAGYCPHSTVPALVAQVAAAFPEVPALPREALLADAGIDIICSSAVPNERAGIAIAALRAGKDAMVDKPGVTEVDQLVALQAAVRETGRIWSVCFSERLCSPASVRASQLVAEGAIGRVVQTVGLGPHRKGRVRPDWFWDMQATGGILVDIASHQIDQFLHYTGSTGAQLVSAGVGNVATPEHPAFQDVGDLLLQSPQGRGFIRVDWLTPDGLPTWGDGRLTILGTEGYIELRKYIDIAGRPGGNHLFIADRQGTRHIDCSDVALEYFKAFVHDVRTRGETAMTQAHVFEVCRLSLAAQQLAQAGARAPAPGGDERPAFEPARPMNLEPARMPGRT